MVKSIDPVYLTKVVECKLQEHGLFFAISPEVFVKTPSVVGELMSPLVEHMTIGMKMHIPVHEVLSYVKPRDWWEHVKQRFAPTWFKKRYPIIYDDVKVEQLINKVALSNDYGDIFRVSFNGKTEHLPPYGHDHRLGYCMTCQGPVPYSIEEEMHVRTPRLGKEDRKALDELLDEANG